MSGIDYAKSLILKKNSWKHCEKCQRAKEWLKLWIVRFALQICWMRVVIKLYLYHVDTQPVMSVQSDLKNVPIVEKRSMQNNAFLMCKNKC